MESPGKGVDVTRMNLEKRFIKRKLETKPSSAAAKKPDWMIIHNFVMMNVDPTSMHIVLSCPYIARSRSCSITLS